MYQEKKLQKRHSKILLNLQFNNITMQESLSSKWLQSQLDNYDQDSSNGQGRSLYRQMQKLLSQVFHKIIDLNVVNPYLYSLIQLLSVIQTLYFVTYGVKFSQGEGDLGDFHGIFEHLPIFPFILGKTKESETAYLAAQLTLLSGDALFLGFIAFFMYRLYINNPARLLSNTLSKGGVSSANGGTQMITAVSLMQMREEASIHQNPSQIGEKNSQDTIKISGFFKIAVRTSSLYFIIQTELLTIPGIVLSLMPMTCRSIQYTDKAGSTYFKNEDYYIGTECWKGLHTFNFLCGIIHLALLFVCKLLYLYFMHDTFLLELAPWTQFSPRPQIFNQLAIFSFSVWYVFDLEKQYNIAANIIAIVLYSLTLSVRYVTPMYSQNACMHSTLIGEVTRLWFLIIVVLCELIGVKVEGMSIAVLLITDIAICYLANAFVQQRILRNLERGRDNISKEDEFELYLHTIFSLTHLQNEDHHHENTQSGQLMKQEELAQNFIGLLQTHIRTCKDLIKCPCHQIPELLAESDQSFRKNDRNINFLDVQNDEQYEGNQSPSQYLNILNNGSQSNQNLPNQQSYIPTEGAEDNNNNQIANVEDENNPFKKKKTLLQQLGNDRRYYKVGPNGLSNLSKSDRLKLIADAFNQKFESLRSKRAGLQSLTNLVRQRNTQQRFGTSINEKDALHRMQEETSIVWIAIVKHWIKARLAQTDQAISTKMRYLISQFMFVRVKNEFQALFEIMVAESNSSGSTSLSQRFKLYSLRKRIENAIVRRYELLNLQNTSGPLDDKRVNILTVHEFETGYSRLQQAIAQNTGSCIKFWQQLLEKNIDAAKLHATGIAISDKHQEISRVANRLLLLQPSNVAMLLTYSRYLNDIINNEYYAHDIFSLAFGQRLNFKSHLAGKKDTHAVKEAALFGENGFCSIFILRTDFRNLGVVEFANHEVHTMFGYRPEQLIGKDISCIMPESIGSVHRQLMMRFFDKGESPIINKFRELFVRDSDGYLVPVLIYPKVLPNLTNGLKFIGAIKRIATLQDEDLLGGAHLPQNDLQKLPQEYLLCDKDSYVCHFTSGLSLEVGLFPRMFMHPSALQVGSAQQATKEIKIDELSLDFVNKESELVLEGGCYINMNTQKVIEKVERENVSQEEYAYLLSKQRIDFKVFCQLVVLNYGNNLADMRLYRIIVINNSTNNNGSQGVKAVNSSQEQLKHLQDKHLSTNQQLAAAKDPQDFFNLNIASQSASSQGSQSSLFAVDRQLRDLKLHITENKEPRQVALLRRFIYFLVLFLTLSSSLVFMWHVQESGGHSQAMREALKALEMQAKFVQLQMNMRTLIDLANNVEPEDNNTVQQQYTTFTRAQHLSNLSSSLVEDLRQLNNYLSSGSSSGSTMLLVREIDRKGYPYEYQLETKLAIDQYITKAIDILFEYTTGTQAAYKYPSQESPIVFTNATSTIDVVPMEKAVFYVMHTGYRVLLGVIEGRAADRVRALESFERYTQAAIRWVDICSGILIVLVHMLLAVVVQLIQENKVRVLALYSEVRVSQVRDSLQKCSRFQVYMFLNNKQAVQNEQNHLHHAKKRLADTLDEYDNESDSKTHFRQQWEAFSERLQYFKLDDSQRLLQHLKDNLQALRAMHYQQLLEQEDTGNFNDGGTAQRLKGGDKNDLMLLQAVSSMEMLLSNNKHRSSGGTDALQSVSDLSQLDQPQNHLHQNQGCSNNGSSFAGKGASQPNFNATRRQPMQKKTMHMSNKAKPSNALALKVSQNAYSQAKYNNSRRSELNQLKTSVRESRKSALQETNVPLTLKNFSLQQQTKAYMAKGMARIVNKKQSQNSSLSRDLDYDEDEEEERKVDDRDMQIEEYGSEEDEEETKREGDESESESNDDETRSKDSNGVKFGPRAQKGFQKSGRHSKRLYNAYQHQEEGENQSIDPKDAKIGKEDQFQQIHKRNWRQFILIALISCTLIAFYAFSYFFHQSVNEEIKGSSNDLKVGMLRQKTINLLFAAMRERVTILDMESREGFYGSIEERAIAEFYANEDLIQQRMARHADFEDFLYDLIDTQDSKDFCDSLQPLPAVFGNCTLFHQGVLQQGYKQSLFSFIKFYTQMNFTFSTYGNQGTIKQNTTEGKNKRSNGILENPDIRAFYIAQETFYQRATEILLQKWMSKIVEHNEWETSIVKAAFAVFLIVFYMIEIFLVPLIIRQLNETTWRSRGILNLVPNEAFKEFKGNAKVMLLFNQ